MALVLSTADDQANCRPSGSFETDIHRLARILDSVECKRGTLLGKTCGSVIAIER